MFSIPNTKLPATRLFPNRVRGHNRLMATVPAERQATAVQVALRQFGARLFEAAPGLVTWILLLAPAWIPIIFQSPGALVVALTVLLFDIYWLLRSVSGVTGGYSPLWRVGRAAGQRTVPLRR